MRNIIHLLYRYNAVIVFVVLQVAAFALIFTYSPFHRASYFNSSLTVVGWMEDVTSKVNEPFTAIKENKQLRKENAELRDRLAHNFYHSNHGPIEISDSLFDQQFTYTPAKVVDNSYNQTQNYILIDIGKNHGVKKDMGVVGPDGIVGFVKDPGPQYSLVIPVINPNFNTAAKVKGKHYFGILDWQGGDDQVARLEGLEKTNPVKEGDTLITKGSTGRFPQGIPVGTVKSAKEVAGNDEYDLKVSLFTNFRNLHYVYVVSNVHKAELDSIKSELLVE